MLSIVQSRPYTRNSGNRQRCVNSRRRITRHFTPVPRGHLDAIPSLVIRSAYAKLLELSIGRGFNSCEIEHERLGELLKRDRDTVRGYIRWLKRHGYIHSHERRISRSMSRPNRYTFPKLAGLFADAGGGDSSPQIQENLKAKTNTPAREAAREVHKPRERAKVENNSPAMAKLYHHNSVLQAENRSLRAMVRGRHSWNHVPSSDTFAAASADLVEQNRRDIAEALDRMQPGWREKVGYGL